jgi:hypothetical protein
MRQPRLDRALVGTVLLLVSCGSVTGQTADGGGGRGGTGGGAGTSGSTGGAGGAGGGNASCATVPACGGDLVGTWRVTGSCLTATKDLSSVCAGASATIAYMISGTLTYNADQTYSQALAATAMVHEHYPSGCMPFGLTCAQLGQAVADAAAPVSAAACSTDASGACNCDSLTTATVNNMPGTYSTSGDTLTTVQGSTTSTTAYCVMGGVLYELPAASDGGLTSMGDIVLTKQ